ncbi:MAG: hypothetical protein K6G84_01430 [Lachnospiraceae bacterium]|nr:hypothetical protein [Lachnospiraceae bacterium]
MAEKTAIKTEIETPVGTLVVETGGTIEEYPRVHVYLVPKGETDRHLVSCVEYDTGSEELRTECYAESFDEPVSIIRYNDGKDLMG